MRSVFLKSLMAAALMYALPTIAVADEEHHEAEKIEKHEEHKAEKREHHRKKHHEPKPEEHHDGEHHE